MANSVCNVGQAVADNINDSPAEVPQAGIDPQNPHYLSLLCCFFDALARKANKRQWQSINTPKHPPDAAMQQNDQIRRSAVEKRPLQPRLAPYF
ncbi:MAG: hypothetical protein ACU0B7_01995 [Paracoccaceae bacterium]